MENTFNSYLAQQVAAGSLTGALAEILLAVGGVCGEISALLGGGGSGVLGSAGTENVQGETQKKLDVISNDLFLDRLPKCAALAGLASEEMTTSRATANATSGRYLLLFDPLDGSSNIDVNISVGTIFSLLRKDAGKALQDKDFLQPGKQQVAAGFAVYGPATLLVLTLGNGVVTFTLDRSSGAFVQNATPLAVPASSTEFAINASNQRFWEEPVQRYIGECLAGKDGPRGKNFNMRWVASMVADVYRVLCRGGVFLYPKDNKDPAKAGKLRLMYEANPMSLVVEQAGGKASTGRMDILAVEPQALHQRVPVILGSSEEVERIVGYHAPAR